MNWIGYLIVLMLGLGIGGSMASPNTKTEVIHRDHHHTKTVTVTEHEPFMPDACGRAIEYARQVDDYTGQAFASLYRVEEAIRFASVGMGVQDPQMLVAAREKANTISNDTRLARQNLMKARTNMQEQLAMCQEEIEDE